MTMCVFHGWAPGGLLGGSKLGVGNLADAGFHIWNGVSVPDQHKRPGEASGERTTARYGSARDTTRTASHTRRATRLLWVPARLVQWSPALSMSAFYHLADYHSPRLLPESVDWRRGGGHGPTLPACLLPCLVDRAGVCRNGGAPTTHHFPLHSSLNPRRRRRHRRQS